MIKDLVVETILQDFEREMQGTLSVRTIIRRTGMEETTTGMLLPESRRNESRGPHPNARGGRPLVAPPPPPRLDNGKSRGQPHNQRKPNTQRYEDKKQVIIKNIPPQHNNMQAFLRFFKRYWISDPDSGRFREWTAGPRTLRRSCASLLNQKPTEPSR